MIRGEAGRVTTVQCLVGVLLSKRSWKCVVHQKKTSNLLSIHCQNCNLTIKKPTLLFKVRICNNYKTAIKSTILLSKVQSFYQKYNPTIKIQPIYQKYNPNIKYNNPTIKSTTLLSKVQPFYQKYNSTIKRRTLLSKEEPYY